MVHDITDRKQAELKQKLLLDELNHRVKNTLATVQSLASRMAYRDYKLERFLSLNGMSASSPLTPGDKVKLVIYGARRS